MKKIIELSHLTLTPNLLFGEIDATATHGKIHAQAVPVMEHEGQQYASTDPNLSPDVKIGVPALALDARMLFQSAAQQLADDAGCTVCYRVNGEVRTVEPTAK